MDDDHTPDPAPHLDAIRRAAAAAAAFQLHTAAAVEQARKAGATLRQVSEAANVSHEQVRRLEEALRPLNEQVKRHYEQFRKMATDPEFLAVVDRTQRQSAALVKALEKSGTAETLRRQTEALAKALDSPAMRQAFKNAARPARRPSR